jgi:hypothetical protein
MPTIMPQTVAGTRSRTPRSVCELARLGAAQQHRLVRARPPAQDIRIGARWPFDQHLLQRPQQLLVARVRVALDDLDEALEAFALDLLTHLVVHARGVRAPPRRVDERERVVEGDLLADGQRLREVRLALAREADDHIGGQRQARHRLAQARRERHEALARVGAPHRTQDPRRARLQGQVHVLADRRALAVGRDDVVAHVLGMRARVADALDAAHGVEQP